MVLYLKEGKKDAIMSFGEKLSYFKKRKGLSNHEIGILIGASDKAVYGFEQGVFKPWQPETYEILAEVFGCTAEELENDSAKLNILQDNRKEEKAMKKESSSGKVLKEEQKIVEQKPFGQRLNGLRTEKGLSLNQVADAVGIKSGAYKGMEYKNSRPRDVKVYDKLAEVFGCEVAYLTAEDERFEKKSGEKTVETPAPVESTTENSTETPAPTEIPTEPTEEIMNAPIEAPVENSTEKIAPAEIPTEITEEIMNAPIENPTKSTEAPVKDKLTLAEKLKALRKEKKIKLKDLAAQTGLSYDQYKSLEYRDGRPRNVKTYDKLAKVLGCEASYLAEGDKRYKVKDEKPAKKAALIPSKKPAPAEESISTEEPVPTVAAVDEKSEPIPTVTAMDKASIQDMKEIEENIPIDSVEEPVVPAEKSSASSEVIKLVSRLSVLLSGDEISKSEKDAVMVSLNGAYWR